MSALLVIVHIRSLRFSPHVLHRMVACGCAALILLLLAAVVRPDVHEELHTHDDCASESHSCAVVLFAQGALALVAAVHASAPTAWIEANSRACEVAIALARIEFLQPPGRGPPAVQG
jgi:hypothetical protein